MTCDYNGYYIICTDQSLCGCFLSIPTSRTLSLEARLAEASILLVNSGNGARSLIGSDC